VGLTKIRTQGRLEVNTIKYFLAQALGSVILLYGLLLTSFSFSAAPLIITLRLFIKLGVFPFHTWFISFVRDSHSLELWVVSIFQKLIPLWALVKFTPTSFIVWIRILIGRYIRIRGALKNTRYTIILGYSSIFNASWIIATLGNLDSLAVFISCYAVSLAAFLTLTLSLFTQVSQELRRLASRWPTGTLLTISLLNLGGMPPFLNFWGKAALLERILRYSSLYRLVFILASISFMYVYVSILFSQIIFLSSKHTSWKPSQTGRVGLSAVLGLSLVIFIF